MAMDSGANAGDIEIGPRGRAEGWKGVKFK